MKRSREPKSELHRDLMRLLHGEASEEEAATLRERMTEDSVVAERYAELESLWNGMDLPEAKAGEDFLPQVRARVAANRDESVAAMWRLAPAWGRAVAVSALALGIALGAALGASDAVSAEEIVLEKWASEDWASEDWASEDWADLNLAERYWLALENELDADSESEGSSEAGVTP